MRPRCYMLGLRHGCDGTLRCMVQGCRARLVRCRCGLRDLGSAPECCRRSREARGIVLMQYL